MFRTALHLVIVLSATLLLSQQSSLVQNIEDAIRLAEPDWRCTHGIWNGPPPVALSEKTVLSSSWEHTSKDGNVERVSLHISQVDSLDDAKLSLRSVREGRLAPEWTRAYYDIGDEGYLATYRVGGPFSIAFRKNKIVVRVASDSIELTEKFATYAASHIPSR